MQEKITKKQINLLIDVLVTSGGGKSQYGKLNEIIKTYTTENRLIRNTLLIWLDSMGIMDVDYQNHNNYYLNKPLWLKSSIENHYILYGAITNDEIKELEINSEVKKYDGNKISYNNFEIELPDTYYTTNPGLINELDYEVIENPIFSAIDNMEGLSLIENKLHQGILQEIKISNDKQSNDVDGYRIILNQEQTPLNIFPQYDIKQFNWRTRNYIKCDIVKELSIEEEEEGLKLIKVIIPQDSSGNHKMYYTFLLEKSANEEWKFTYFDPTIVDERWARYLFIDKLEFYDIEKDFRGRDDMSKLLVFQNAKSAFNNKSVLIEQNPESSNFMKIPNVIRKQLVQYDSRQGLIAFPVSMPLPKEIMRYLFSCSGSVPQVFKNKFTINPDYNIKKLFSGILSPEGTNVPFANQKYFMEEDFYLFSHVPTQLAEKIFEKLNLDMTEDVYKRTFLQKI